MTSPLPPAPASQSTGKGIALITGSAQGIGRAIALQLARDGFHVAVNDIVANDEKLDGVMQEMRSSGREVRVMKVVADVSVEEEVSGMVEKVVAEFGGLDVVSVLYTVFVCFFVPVVFSTPYSHYLISISITFPIRLHIPLFFEWTGWD
jgi:hypothetical protein